MSYKTPTYSCYKLLINLTDHHPHISCIYRKLLCVGYPAMGHMFLLLTDAFLSLLIGEHLYKIRFLGDMAVCLAAEARTEPTWWKKHFRISRLYNDKWGNKFVVNRAPGIAGTNKLRPKWKFRDSWKRKGVKFSLANIFQTYWNYWNYA